VSFASILQGLNAAKVKLVLIGGLAAAAHGSRRVTDDVDICYDSSPENLKRLAATLEGWDAYPRGIEPGLPFFIDDKQFRVTPIMTLTTREGLLDVMDIVKGVGDYRACKLRSVTISAFDIRLRALDLAALIDAKRAAGRPRDLDHIPELEALLALKG
jgi:hypothetical protein